MILSNSLDNSLEKINFGQGSVEGNKTNRTNESVIESQNDTEKEIIRHITKPEVVSQLTKAAREHADGKFGTNNFNINININKNYHNGGEK